MTAATPPPDAASASDAAPPPDAAPPAAAVPRAGPSPHAGVTSHADAAGAMDETRARVWRGLRTLVHERHDRRKEVSETLGMSFIRVRALRHLAAAGPMSMRRLAADLQTEAPYTTVFVDDLVRRGYVRRVADPADKRVKIIQLTDAGADVASRADAILDEPPGPVRALSPKDLQALDRIVAALLGQ